MVVEAFYYKLFDCNIIWTIRRSYHKEFTFDTQQFPLSHRTEIESWFFCSLSILFLLKDASQFTYFVGFICISWNISWCILPVFTSLLFSFWILFCSPLLVLKFKLISPLCCLLTHNIFIRFCPFPSPLFYFVLVKI